VAGVNRVNPAEHHRMNFLKTWQRLPRRIALIRYGIANFYVGGAFDVGDEVANIARLKSWLHIHLGREHSYLLDLVTCVVAHQLDRVRLFHMSGHDAHVADYTAINIEH